MAYRYGWGAQFDSDQAAAEQPRVPRRILDRAAEAYRKGQLGVGVQARLQDRSVAQVEQALAEAGIVVEPAVRRADVAARYDQPGVVARWSDLAARCARAIWVVVPQLARMRGALVDGKPLQFGSNGQFVEVDAGWHPALERQLAGT